MSQQIKPAKNQFLRRKITRLFAIVWPPLGETSKFEISLKLGMVMSDNPFEMIVVAGDISHAWGCETSSENIPLVTIPWCEYEFRMQRWFTASQDSFLEDEYYELTGEPAFQNLINSEIIDVEDVFVEDDEEAFGIRLIVKDDFILIAPNASGSTFETKEFSGYDILGIYSRLGDIRFRTTQ